MRTIILVIIGLLALDNHNALRSPVSLRVSCSLRSSNSRSLALYSTNSEVNSEREVINEKEICDKLDREFAGVALPAFFSLAADPLASLVDAMYVGRLTAADQVTFIPNTFISLGCNLVVVFPRRLVWELQLVHSIV